MGKGSTSASPKASKAAARVRAVIAKKNPPAAAGVAKGTQRAQRAAAAATPPKPAAPALSRSIRSFKADTDSDAIIGTWHGTHVAFKIAEFQNELARSAAVAVYDRLGADIIHTSEHGSPARQHRKGEVDYKAMAIAKLGASTVTSLEEEFRKDGSDPVTAPNAWSAEAGLQR